MLRIVRVCTVVVPQPGHHRRLGPPARRRQSVFLHVDGVRSHTQAYYCAREPVLISTVADNTNKREYLQGRTQRGGARDPGPHFHN